MKHHYADLLDRDGAYWTVVPNIERYAYMIGKTSEGSPDVRIATLGKDDKDWKKVFTFPNLEELTLHEPSKAQLEAQWELPKLTRLRITHARPKTLEFVGSLPGVEELVLEYVSGFSDLSPLRSLTRLRSLHVENLRRVRAFDGLSGIRSLTFLRIDGTLDWNQPIADFEFLRGLPALEVLSFGSVISPAPFPALLPALSLKNLKQLHGRTNLFAAAEYALL